MLPSIFFAAILGTAVSLVAASPIEVNEFHPRCFEFTPKTCWPPGSECKTRCGDPGWCSGSDFGGPTATAGGCMPHEGGI
ncbi:hypothetical protein MPH_12502 [Macrophomina phaseolina MS6]|uniref:Uncharacterized protein n=1 Tax=Macrophomina phaseolina (strain MS6) TaxID=1126212 RepID=K2R7S0_MACPH|nr:hypothetical protein MPH_12502 [Macrophomina phaseolina MS6]